MQNPKTCFQSNFFTLGLFCLGTVLLFITLIFWPLPVLFVESRGEVLVKHPFLLGNAYTTRIIHSVEQTPVEDEYRIVHQKIWSWQERVQSHNAGLPFSRPANGDFIVEKPWFIIQGGRFSFEQINYRVGQELLGHNELSINSQPYVALYKTYPLRLFLFRVGQATMLDNFFINL